MTATVSQPQIALLQLVSSTDVDINLKRTAELLAGLSGCGINAVFLPENFAALANPDPRRLGEAEATPQGPIRSFLREMAIRHGFWIYAGTLPTITRPDGSTVDGNRVRAASLVLNDSGQELARYDKIHMFDVEVDDSHGSYRESDTFEPGDTPVCIDTPIGTVGLSVCYDIRFPELYRRLFLARADIITIPSAFTTTTGEAHFSLLMRARAVENTCFTIAACQGGQHDSGRQTWGHSMVVGPWGEVLGELETGEGVLTASLDLSSLDRIRRDMPTFQQRKLL